MKRLYIPTECGGTYYPVVAHDHVSVDTGILDASGEPIYRHPMTVGFVTDFPKQKPRFRVNAGSDRK